MADNVTTNPGTGGANIATDEIGGAHYQRVKLTFGADGAATDVSSSAKLPVDVAFPATQPVSGTVTATVGTSITGGTISPLTVAGVTCEASAARTTTANGTTITNASARGATFFINVSAASGTTPTLVAQLQVQDPVSLAFVDVPGAVTATITGISLTMLTVCPGIVEAANSRVSNGLPRVFRWRWTIGGTTPSFTFSIGAAYII